MAQLCRLCLREAPAHFSLLEEPYRQMLKDLTAIDVREGDETTAACSDCLQELKVAHGTQQSILKADAKLRGAQKPPEQINTEPDIYMSDDENGGHSEGSVEENIEEANEEPGEAPGEEKAEDKLRYSCEECKQSFPTEFKLATHSHTKFKLEVYTCPMCQKQSADLDKFRAHYNSHKREPCPICGKVLSSCNMKLHVRNHSSVPAICELCGKTVSNRDSLRSHMFYSHNSYRYKCDQCGKEFQKKNIRDRHIRQEHTGEWSHVCDSCGKKFFDSTHLRIHIKSRHLKLRPHVCKYCQKAFAHKHGLKTHERQHTNEHPYKCEECHEAFRQKVSLKSHMKSKHGLVEPENFFCAICGKGFASKQALQGHNNKH